MFQLPSVVCGESNASIQFENIQGFFSPDKFEVWGKQAVLSL